MLIIVLTWLLIYVARQENPSTGLVKFLLGAIVLVLIISAINSYISN